MSRRTLKLVLVMGVVSLLAVGGVAVAGGGGQQVREQLTGYEEVPAVSTTGHGDFRAELSRNGSTVSWRLSYDALEGDVQQAHIHFGQEAVNGGISVFLCTNLGNSTRVGECPPPPATITGSFGPDDVIGPADRGMEPGAFNELLSAIRAGSTYVNVHSSKWPGGEIRAQLDERGRRGDD